jgi:ribosomal protein L40E
MKCPCYQHENPPQAKFCLECGARVALTCTKCRSELPAGAKFCLECGAAVASQATAEARFASPESYTPKHLAEKILTSKSALEGERKQVTQSRRHSPTRLASMSTPRMPGTLGSLNPSPTTKRLV